jgi:hypothetical protein
MISRNEWFLTQLRRDGDYDLMPTSETNPRAMRGTPLFHTPKLQIVVGEAIGKVGLANFDRFVGYPLWGPSLEGQRFEIFIYEFALSGRNSWEFSIA